MEHEVEYTFPLPIHNGTFSFRHLPFQRAHVISRYILKEKERTTKHRQSSSESFISSFPIKAPVLLLFYAFLCPEAATGGVLQKMVFLEISQNSQ